MKKLILAAAPAALIAVFAASPVSAGNTHLSGFIDEVCEAVVVDNDLWLSGNVVAGATIGTDVNFDCNDHDGATVTLTSTEGGLESDDDEDFEVEYVATLVAGPMSIVLDTGLSTNVNDISETGQLPNSSPNGTMTIVLSDTAPWAGGYSDTIQVDIAAN